MFYYFFYAHNQIADNLCDELNSIKDQLKSTPKKDMPNLVEKALNLTCQIYLFYINEMYGENPIEYILKKELLSKKSLECLRQWESSKKQNVKILEPVFMEIAEILRKDELQRSDKEHAEKFANIVEWIYLNASRCYDERKNNNIEQLKCTCDIAKPYVFISYSHKDEDKEEVYEIINKMYLNGYNVWFDEGIYSGAEWADYIALRVEGADSFIAFLSKNYLKSDNCKNELEYARINKKEINFVFLDDVELKSGKKMNYCRFHQIRKNNYIQQNDFYEKLFSSPSLKRSLKVV